MKGTLLRGTNRRMVVVKSRDSKVFEEAHFILREERDAPLPDLLDEANRIVEQSRIPGPRKTRPKKGGYFIVGLLTGAAIEALGLLLCALIR